ncbi:MAG: hydrolase family protein [Mucilaginibacter sp.]|nr:hydrolase family protein [Mucilaginibacter sp.]
MKKLILVLLLVISCFSFTQKEPTWVAVGDSITYLNDHQDETGNRITKGYMTRVCEKLPYISYKNQGHNGWTAGQIAQRIDSLGIEKADIYTVFLGTNDWWGGHKIGTMSDYQNNTGINTIYGSLRIIINKLRTLNPNAHIVLITPMQRTDFVYINDMKNNAYGSYKTKSDQSLEQVAEAIVNIGETEKFKVIDLYHLNNMDIKHLVNFKRLKNPETGAYKDYPYPAYINIPFNPQTDAYPYPPEAVNITYDGLHPSDKGFAIIAGKLIDVFKSY